MKYHYKFRFGIIFLIGLFIVELTSSSSFAFAKTADQETSAALIAFIGEDGNVWMVRPDGTNLTQITHDAASNITYASPSWAPDGTQLAVASEREGNQDIYILGLDGAIVRRVTDDPGKDFDPAWSPDGQRLAFVSERDGNQEIYATDTNGENSQNLTHHPGNDYEPSWSPDGTQIVFTSSRETGGTGLPGIYILKLDSGEVQPYIPGGGLMGGEFPSWSPDGERIAYSPVYPDCCGNIVFGDLENTHVVDVTELYNTTFCPSGNCLALSQGNPTWSADGNWMAYDIIYYQDFLSWEVINTEIRLTNLSDELPGKLDGTNSVVIAKGTEPAWWPAFATPSADLPSEGWIAFIGEDNNVWMVHPDGSELNQITTDANDRLAYANPKWSPEGNLLAFTQGASLLLYDVVSKGISHITSGVLLGYDWAGDGSKIIYGKCIDANFSNLTNCDGLWLFDLESRQEHIAIPPPNDSYLTGPDWSPEGNRLIFALCNSGLITDVCEIQITELNDPSNFHPLEIAIDSFCDWAPDGNLLACPQLPPFVLPAPGPCPLALLDKEGKVVQELPSSNNACDYLPKWSPNGEWIAFTASYISLDLVTSTEIYKSDGSERKNIYPYGSLRSPLTWSPDSRFLLVSGLDDEIILVNIETGVVKSIGIGDQGVWQPPRPKTPPPAITDLQVYPDKASDERGAIRLIWNNTSINSHHEISNIEYDIRYSDQPITESNWAQAIHIEGEPDPDHPTPEEVWLLYNPDLQLNTRWYFAIKSRSVNGDWSGLSNVTSYIDSGFRAIIDGYKFPNQDPGWGKYPNPPTDQDFTLEDTYTMFGGSVCLPPLDLGPCVVYSPSAILWHQFVNRLTTEAGHCTGMAIASLNIYQNPEVLNQIKPGAVNVFSDEVTLSDMRRYITYYHVEQSALPVLTYKLAQSWKSKPSDTLDTIREALLSGEPVELELSETGNGWHSVTPLALMENSDGIASVYIYDNNHPGEIRYLTIVPEEEIWSYGNLTGTDKTHTLYAVPLSLFNGPQVLPLLTYQIVMGNITFGHIVITDDQERRIGQIEGEFINEIPNAGASSFSGGLGVDAPIYVLPLEGSYSIHIEGTGLTEKEDVSLAHFGSGFSIVLDNIALNPNTSDQISITSNGREISYHASEPQDATIRMAHDGESTGYIYQLEGVNIESGETVMLKISPETENLTLSHVDGGNSIYDIKITQLDTKGERTFIYQDIEISATGVHTFDVQQWDDLAHLTLEIDKNGDGQIDEEVQLNNQAEQTTISLDESVTLPMEGSKKFYELLWFGPTLSILGLVFFIIGILGILKSRKL